MAQYSYWPRYGLENYSYTFPMEDSFDPVESTKWMERNWIHSFIISAIYVVLIYVGQKFMEARKPFALDNALCCWNMGLAIFSLTGTLRMMPEIFWSVNSNSFVYSICTASYAQGVTGYWTEKFAMSKVFELIDTAFIVLRKKPLIFLHWYHHVTVLAYTWHAYKDHTASGRWFVFMNYTVHAFMYSYYALRAMRVRVPKLAAMLITLLQIAQMVVGVFIGVAIYFIKNSGSPCQQTWTNLYFSFTIYFSYFLLFCNFFYHAYLKRNNRYLKRQEVNGTTQKNNMERTVNGHCLNGSAKKNCEVDAKLNDADVQNVSLIELVSQPDNTSENENETIEKINNSTRRRSSVTHHPLRSSPPVTRSRRVARVD